MLYLYSELDAAGVLCVCYRRGKGPGEGNAFWLMAAPDERSCIDFESHVMSHIMEKGNAAMIHVLSITQMMSLLLIM